MVWHARAGLVHAEERLKALFFGFQREKYGPAFAGPAMGMSGSVCPVAVVFSVHGMGFHVGEEFLRGQPCPAGALGMAGGGLLWRGIGWLRCRFRDRVNRDVRDRLGCWRRRFLRLLCWLGFRRISGRLRGGDAGPVCFRCGLRLRWAGDGRIRPVDHHRGFLGSFRLRGVGCSGWTVLSGSVVAGSGDGGVVIGSSVGSSVDSVDVGVF